MSYKSVLSLYKDELQGQLHMVNNQLDLIEKGETNKSEAARVRKASLQVAEVGKQLRAVSVEAHR